MLSTFTGILQSSACGSQLVLSLITSNLAFSSIEMTWSPFGANPSSSQVSRSMQAMALPCSTSRTENDSTAAVSTLDTPPPVNAQ